MSHGRHAYNRAKRRGGFMGRADLGMPDIPLTPTFDEYDRFTGGMADDADERELNDEWMGEEER